MGCKYSIPVCVSTPVKQKKSRWVVPEAEAEAEAEAKAPSFSSDGRPNLRIQIPT